MPKYRVNDINASLGLFLDEEYEADDKIDCIDQILNEIMDNLGNYIDVDLEEIEDSEESEEMED